MTTPIPVYGPWLDDADRTAIDAVLLRGWLGMGADVAAFEQAVLDALGCNDRHAVAVSTGGAALHVALIVAGVGPGDEVIVPSICHLSNVQAILACGAEAVFVDVDETMCIDVNRVAEMIGPKTRAIMALDYACYLSDQPALRSIAARRSIRVVHDAAHSFGSAVEGRAVGADSDMCMFSFDPVKSLTAIDAGVLVFADPAEAIAAREIRLLGSDQPPAVMYRNARTWDYDAIRTGYRYHLSNVHAALGTSQIAKLDAVRSSRQSACEWYAERLKGLDHVWSPQIDFSDLCPFMYVIRVPAADRDPLRGWLDERGIKTGVHWRPGHVHTYFQQFRRGPLPVTEQAAAELITVPLHSHMDESTVDRVCTEISAYFRH